MDSILHDSLTGTCCNCELELEDQSQQSLRKTRHQSVELAQNENVTMTIAHGEALASNDTTYIAEGSRRLTAMTVSLLDSLSNIQQEDRHRHSPPSTSIQQLEIQGENTDVQISDLAENHLPYGQLNSLLDQYRERERSLEEQIKILADDLQDLGREYVNVVAERDGLIAQCNQLVKQKVRQRSGYFSEADEEVIKKAFGSLAYEVRSWCVELWDQKHPDTRWVLTTYLLSKRQTLPPIVICNHWLLVATLWEWLIELVFDVDQTYSPRLFDLWNDQVTAQSVEQLEARIAKLHPTKPDIQREWRSFTAQCLGGSHAKLVTPPKRFNDIASTIMDSFVGPLGISDVQVLQRLRQQLSQDVIQEAALLTQMMASRVQPTKILLPHNVATAVARSKGGLVSIYVKPRLMVHNTLLIKEEAVDVQLSS